MQYRAVRIENGVHWIAYARTVAVVCSPWEKLRLCTARIAFVCLFVQVPSQLLSEFEVGESSAAEQSAHM